MSVTICSHSVARSITGPFRVENENFHQKEAQTGVRIGKKIFVFSNESPLGSVFTSK